jgi:hypothetical protein
MTTETSGEVRIALADPERVLMEEIADKRMKREDVALTYALAIASGEEIDWPKVNRAIMDRWSASAMRWIKEFAWRQIRRSTQSDPEGGQ